MRLISQDGRVDFPYDKVMVEIDPANMQNIILTTPEMAAMGQAFVAAEYSSPEKARKVMDQLHYAYKNHLKSGGRVTHGGNFFYTPEVRFDQPKVFKFPEDSEV